MLNISRQNALQIVTDISEIIGQHVNMMDSKGTIIASTDPLRIGTYHAAACKIVAESLTELVIEDNNQYAGSRKGLNLPVLYEGNIVGVIGVTGDVAEVGKYGQIIKKMTEILLLENQLNEQKKIDDRILTRFLDEWLFDDLPHTPSFVERGRRHGIDITLNRRVLVAEIANIEEYSDSTEGQQMIDTMNKSVRRLMEKDPRNVFTKTASQMICLMAGCEDEALAYTAQEIIERARREYSVDVLVGVDAPSTTLKQGYNKACKALRACRYSSRGYCFYNDITVEIFMDEIPRKSKMEFVQRMFRGFTSAETDVLVQMLRIYYDCNGSINQAAEKLFIHKNTLQYKLNRLQEITGYNPRNLRDSALFYLALQFYEEEKQLAL